MSNLSSLETFSLFIKSHNHSVQTMCGKNWQMSFGGEFHFMTWI
jgi:hypothetical protein